MRFRGFPTPLLAAALLVAGGVARADPARRVAVLPLEVKGVDAGRAASVLGILRAAVGQQPGVALVEASDAAAAAKLGASEIVAGTLAGSGEALSLELDRTPARGASAGAHVARLVSGGGEEVAEGLRAAASELMAAPLAAEGGAQASANLAATPSRPGVSTGRAVALVVGGLGLAALGAGTYFGLQSSSETSAAEKLQASGTTSVALANSAEARRHLSAARSNAVAANVLWVAGGLAVAAQIALWIADAQVTPVASVGPSGASLGVAGAF